MCVCKGKGRWPEMKTRRPQRRRRREQEGKESRYKVAEELI